MKNLVALALLLCVVAVAAVAAADLQSSGAKWWVGTGERDGQLLVVRALAELPLSQVQVTHAWAAKISWTYPQQPDGKFLRNAEREFEFESALEARMEESALALEAISVTIGGKREWTYYASDKDKALDAFESVKRKYPEAPISIKMHRDARWNELRDVLQAAKK